MESLVENRLVQRIVATLGVAGSVALGLVYVVIAGPIVTKPTLYAFWAAWAFIVLVSLYWWASHPWRAFVVPIVGFAAVLAVLWLGVELLGWEG